VTESVGVLLAQKSVRAAEAWPGPHRQSERRKLTRIVECAVPVSHSQQQCSDVAGPAFC